MDASFLPGDAALLDYIESVCKPATDSKIFLSYYDFLPDKSVSVNHYSRAEFFGIVLRAISLIKSQGGKKGTRMVHYFSGNKLEDLVIRTASVFLGTVPVTINWQADTEDQIDYKIESTEAAIIFVDSHTPNVSRLREKYPKIHVIDVKDVHTSVPLNISELESFLRSHPDQIARVSDTRCIIFTSGTTGRPKGVELSYSNYRTNRGTFESFLNFEDPSLCFVPVAVNPMHHTNSTSITDWALRRGNSHLHLLERYSTQYWAVVASISMNCPVSEVTSVKTAETAIERIDAANQQRRAVMPLVSRHIDFLESLAETDSLGVPVPVLRECLATSVLLLGSAPVGPTTTHRLLKYARRLPTVRFGSTETTLQVAGIPLSLSTEEIMSAFQKGWDHKWSDSPCQGFYIGREHDGFTEVAVVRSINREDKENFLKPCVEGQPGYLITRGGHVMRTYVNQPEQAKAAITEDGWYLNLGDVGFYLGHNGRKDLYWQSRDSQMLIRGGANYAFEQVNAELSSFLTKEYPVLSAPGSFSLAMCGIRVKSEHEDECCVMIELLSEEAKSSGVEQQIMESFISRAKKTVTKGAKPDRVAVGHIPILLSKGIVAVPELVKFWKQRALDEMAATASSSSVTVGASVTVNTDAGNGKKEDRFMAALANVDIPDPPSFNPDSLLSPPRRERHGGPRSPAGASSEEKRGSDRFKAALPPVSMDAIPPPPEGGVEPLLSPPRRERHGGARFPGKHSANQSAASGSGAGESASPDQKKHKHADP